MLGDGRSRLDLLTISVPSHYSARCVPADGTIDSGFLRFAGQNILDVSRSFMVTGTCRLCLREGQSLLLSHFVPAGAYRLVRDDDAPNPNPVIVSTTVTIQSSQQARDHLLCADCEDRFNKRGEGWFFQNCWRSNQNFPISSALQASEPSSESSSGFRVYRGADISSIDVDRLAYFGFSLFWRAAVHDWKLAADPPPIRLRLGPYESSLRQYLVGGQAPTNCSLIIAISARPSDPINQAVAFPYLAMKTNTYSKYKAVILGVTYLMFVGKKLPASVRALNSVGSPDRFICLSERIDQLNTATAAATVQRSRAVGKLS